jgi:hypothetical protein
LSFVKEKRAPNEWPKVVRLEKRAKSVPTVAEQYPLIEMNCTLESVNGKPTSSGPTGKEGLRQYAPELKALPLELQFSAPVRETLELEPWRRAGLQAVGMVLAYEQQWRAERKRATPSSHTSANLQDRESLRQKLVAAEAEVARLRQELGVAPADGA